MNLFKDYYCTTTPRRAPRRLDELQFDFHRYLFINRRDTDGQVTSFRIENIFQVNNDIIVLRYSDDWEIYAPLIIEYVVNNMNKNNIYVENYGT